MANTTDSSVPTGKDTYRRLLQAVKKYWPLFVLGIVGTICLSSLDAGFAWLVKPIINKGFIHKDAIFIKWLPLLILLIFTLRGIAGFMSTYYISRVARSVVMDFRRRLFQKLLHLPATFYDKSSSGHLLATIIYNVEQVAQASSDTLVTILRESTLTIGLLGVMLVISWKLTLFLLVTVPLIGLILRYCSKRMRRLSGRVQRSIGDVTHIAEEGIEGYKVIRLYNGSEYESKKFNQATGYNRQQELKVIVTNSLNTTTIQLLMGIPIATILALSTLPGLHINAGSFAAIVTSMIGLTRPVRRLSLVTSIIQKGIAGAQSIFALLDEGLEKDSGTRVIKKSQGAIEFRQVNFAYTDHTKVLENINISIKPGQTIAIVGRSGSGKSTLINLLPRFYDVTAGTICIDGVDIRDYRLQDLRNQFALVSQHPVLFNDTVANNIAYARPDIARTEIEKAAAVAFAHDFIVDIPQGYDSMVGENGVLLSGGQRQRIAIARAVLKNAPILILDEATAALDTESERYIQRALTRLMAKRTTLVIAHRLSTIENADCILVMDKGKIVEQGTHAELLAQSGVYQKLHSMQFREPTTESLQEA